MHEIQDNIIKNRHRYDAICITTNGERRRNGLGICGRGIALSARNEWNNFEVLLGESIRVFDHICRPILKDKETYVFSFPSKFKWKNGSDIVLIEKSLEQLAKWADTLNLQKVALPQPGCNNGHLSWELDIRDLCQSYLDERFYVCTLGKN